MTDYTFAEAVDKAEQVQRWNEQQKAAREAEKERRRAAGIVARLLGVFRKK